MAANNLKQLEEMLKKEMRAAMKEVKEKSLEDMKKGTEYFYSGGSPKQYTRTGALGKTPKTTDISVFGNSMSFLAYLNPNHKYTTGDNPTMMKVLNLANYGVAWTTRGGRPARPTVGNPQFWEYSEKRIEKSLESIMSKHFN